MAKKEDIKEKVTVSNSNPVLNLESAAMKESCMFGDTIETVYFTKTVASSSWLNDKDKIIEDDMEVTQTLRLLTDLNIRNH